MTRGGVAVDRNRPKLLPLLLALSVASCGGDAGGPAERESAPNVLLVSLDTCRADRIGAAGLPALVSPGLDRIARRGVLFTDVLAQAPTTAPSHRSLFTGRYVHEHRNRLEGLPVLAELFRDGGWATAGFVDGGQLDTDFAFQSGFDTYVVSSAEHRDGAFLGGGLAELAPQAVDWLRASRHRPFFLFLHTYDIHCPYFPPAAYRERFVGDRDPGFEIEGKCGQKYFNRLDLGPEGFRYVSDLYDAGVLYTDRLLLAVLREIERSGEAEHTIVVITSDHGESLGERSRIGHNQVRDIQLKIPLLVSGPGISPSVVREPVQSIDLFPTILGLAGLPPPPAASGRDLGPVLAGSGSLPPGRFRLSETGNARNKTVRIDARWSLLLTDGQPRALHDLSRDPFERIDLLASEPGVADRILDEFRDRGIPIETLEELPAALDDETVHRLEALGYTGD
jgi:arylsulfatase A-like enzyme